MGFRMVHYGYAFCLLVVLQLTGCASEPLAPTVFITDQLVEYTPSDEDIIGVTEHGLYLVRDKFIKQAMYDAQKVKEQENQIRQLELKGDQ